MKNIIHFPAADDPGASLEQFFSSAAISDDTPSIDPGFAERLGREIEATTRRRQRRSLGRFNRSALASAALVAIILAGMLMLIASPDRTPSIAPVVEIRSLCDQPVRSQADLENLAFLATIDDTPAPAVETFTASDIRLDMGPGPETLSNLLEEIEVCIRAGHHPLTLPQFTNDLVRYTFRRAYENGTTAEELGTWARSIAQPLKLDEQTSLVRMLDSSHTYSLDRSSRLYLVFDGPETATVLPGLILASPGERFFTGSSLSPDYAVVAPFSLQPHRTGPPDQTIGIRLSLLSYNPSTIKPSEPTPCIASARLGSSVIQFVVDQQAVDDAPYGAAVPLVGFDQLEIAETGGTIPDVLAELSACVRANHAPIALTFFDDGYLAEVFSRYATPDNDLSNLLALGRQQSGLLDPAIQARYLEALLGATFYLDVNNPSMGYVALNAEADIDGFTPGFTVDLAPVDTPEMPNAQRWLATNEAILAPPSELDGRDELSPSDADFVVAPWAELIPADSSSPPASATPIG